MYSPPRVLTALEKRIAEGKLTDRDKMFMRLGRIQASHPQVTDPYENGDQGQPEGGPLPGPIRALNNSLGLLSGDGIWSSVPGLTPMKHVSRAIRVRRRRAFNGSGMFRIESAVMNRMTSR